MIYKAKFGLLSNINKLTQKASDSDPSYFYDVCNVIVSEFDFYAAVLFKQLEEKKFSVLGKSNSVKNDFDDSKIYTCAACRPLTNGETSSFVSDPKCEINITEILTYESCTAFKVSDSEIFLLKLAKKSPFTNDDKSYIKIIVNFLTNLFNKSKSDKIVHLSKPIKNEVYTDEIFIRTVSEVKKFTNLIIGFNSVISDAGLSLSQKDDLKNITRNGKDLQIVMGDLLEYLKISDDSNAKRELDLKPFLQELVDLFNNKKDINNNSFSYSIESKFPFKIKLVDQKLRFVISTLFSICDAFTKSGKINCTVKLDNENAVNFTVSDDSPGIPESKQKFLSESFAVSNIEEFRKSTINGVSYQLAEKYVKEMGGELKCETGNVSGTKFEFTYNGKVTSKLEEKMKDLPSAGKQTKVLLIEDDYATVKLLSNYLNKWGYEPVVVSTERETLTKVREEEFVAAILDIEIPDCNGLELLKKIHEVPKAKNLPVIVSSVAHEEQKAFMLGAVEYFIKPINYKFLVEVLQNYKLKSNSQILCVDDDPEVLSLLKEAIQSAGYNAIAENVSANVMNRIANMNLDLAIVDLDMPHPNGFELIKLIKSEPKFANLPIIIYTGKENYQEDIKSIDGMFESLLEKKSTSFEDLADTINGMINRYDVVPPVEEVIEKEDVVKILLAEDYKHSQIIVTRMLKKNGFENIVVVENGDEALNYAKKEKFSLILMDMQMPIMNGFEATQKIRELPEYNSTPIIALTAFAMKGDREKCLDAGATDYIPKPIDGKEFIEKVKQYTS